MGGWGVCLGRFKMNDKMMVSLVCYSWMTTFEEAAVGMYCRSTLCCSQRDNVRVSTPALYVSQDFVGVENVAED